MCNFSYLFFYLLTVYTPALFLSESMVVGTHTLSFSLNVETYIAQADFPLLTFFLTTVFRYAYRLKKRPA
jgi:hypothetical protein